MSDMCERVRSIPCNDIFFSTVTESLRGHVTDLTPKFVNRPLI